MINWAKFSPYKGKKFSLEDSGKQLLALGGVSLLGWKLGCDLCLFVGWISLEIGGEARQTQLSPVS